MKPISYSSNSDKPFTVHNPSGTVQGLRDALNMLVAIGHGSDSIMRADTEAGPMPVKTLELYSTIDEQKRGEMDSPITVILA